MLDTKLLNDEELRELYSEPLSQQEADAMHNADEAARPFLAVSLSELDTQEKQPCSK
ncbi:MAG: hypothetical protein NTX82_02015 [Candidatus Parcubacteria bacterium]|nr:hypothetical protein [Candidatus Parcubacteria bacterium]